MAGKIKAFFAELESIWGAVPGYVKVFLYASISSIFGLWVAGQLDWRAVAIVVATNLGIYQVPRVVNSGVQRLSGE